jgi:hypothetical protein
MSLHKRNLHNFKLATTNIKTIEQLHVILVKSDAGWRACFPFLPKSPVNGALCLGISWLN